MQPLYEACKKLIKTHARRLPLLDTDSQTGDETVISVLTQYRLLKFIAINVSVIYRLPFLMCLPFITVQRGYWIAYATSQAWHWHLCYPNR